ncbi:hypothetical protein RF11_05135 [Thelohanellus kitauei]|uniref:Uncharacterized protein n=1 Tax=Thelohanellus kitauei TaxID=669202 RepID=A0A0C2JE49_THEKT|nr:hypothetical protein RF11_05135 [Thelohanellus kitauei]
MNFTWMKLNPDCITEREFEGFEIVAVTNTAADIEGESLDDRSFINEMVNIGQNIGFEMYSIDFETLINEHRDKLTAEEFHRFQEEQKRRLTDRMYSDEN